MSSTKLRKYLAYYRQTLSEDPENIEARLRLATLFREMDCIPHAIEEYSMAAKLLASEGLPLEAIAACKAVLELDPTHQDTQFFLAKLYARVPEATGDSVRVARPVTERGRRPTNPDGEVRGFEREPSRPRVQNLTAQEAERVRRQEEPAITLRQPKSTPSMQAPTTEDEQTLNLGVFSMEGLDLEEGSGQGWGDLSILDDLEEPNTAEVDAREAFLIANGLDAPRMQRQFRISALPEMPFFSRLPRQVFLDFLNAMEHQQLAAGSVVIGADDPENCLFVIVRGEVRVEKDLNDGRTVELDTMGEGQIFGEFRLLTGNSGMARVVAQTDLELLTISDELIFAIGNEHPQMWDVLWEHYYARMLNHSLAASQIFGGLSAEERELVMRHFKRDTLYAGEVLFRRGEVVDAISLVVSGAVQVEVLTSRGPQVVDTLREGAFVGVSPTAQLTAATATVHALTDLVVMKMAGQIFRELIAGLPEVAAAVETVVRSRLTKTQSLIDQASVSKLI